MTTTTRLALIGAGSMGRYHLRQILQQRDTTRVVAISEPSPVAYREAGQLFVDAGLKAPPNEPDLERLLSRFALDAAFIITPHAYHHAQATACLEAGLDVLLEKPMVMNAGEAESLIETQRRTGGLLVVAFPGSLSPQLRTAVELLRSGELGQLLSISALAWQGWGAATVGTWRQDPALAGGGFLFDTGAHMLNTVVDLAGEGFVEVAARLDRHGRPVETVGVVMGRLASGAWVTMHGCGELFESLGSDVRAFCTQGILRTGIWGECLELQRAGETQLSPVPVPESLGVWQQFLAVRRGELPNPCPPEVGLRMAHLFDAIQESAAQGGQPVRLAG